MGRSAFLESAGFASKSSSGNTEEDKYSLCSHLNYREKCKRPQKICRQRQQSCLVSDEILGILKQLLSLLEFLLLNQKPEQACRYYLSSSRQLAAACGLAQLLPKFSGTIRLTINLLVSMLILVLISEGVLDGVHHPSLLFAFGNYAVTCFLFCF